MREKHDVCTASVCLWRFSIRFSVVWANWNPSSFSSRHSARRHGSRSQSSHHHHSGSRSRDGWVLDFGPRMGGMWNNLPGNDEWVRKIGVHWKFKKKKRWKLTYPGLQIAPIVGQHSHSLRYWLYRFSWSDGLNLRRLAIRYDYRCHIIPSACIWRRLKEGVGEYSPEHAANLLLRLLTLSPLLKAGAVDIVPACSFAPNDLVAFGLEFAETDGTVARNFFAIVGLLEWVGVFGCW